MFIILYPSEAGLNLLVWIYILFSQKKKKQTAPLELFKLNMAITPYKIYCTNWRKEIIVIFLDIIQFWYGCSQFI